MELLVVCWQNTILIGMANNANISLGCSVSEISVILWILLALYAR